MEFLTSVTEILILTGIGWAFRQSLSGHPSHQEQFIPIPVKDEHQPARR
jgi:hypothetical protein